MKTTNSQHFLSAILLTLFLFLLLSACGESAAPPEPTEEEVENVEMTLTLEDWAEDLTMKREIERVGIYSGTVVDGVPSGKGRFDSQGEDGTKWTYEGDFKNGKFEGKGVQTYDSEDISSLKGTFTNGCFTPDTAEFFEFLITPMFNNFDMSETSVEYMKSHPDYFPAKDADTLEKVKENMDPSISYKHLEKNVADYLETFVTEENLYVGQIEEGTGLGHDYTLILGYSESDFTYTEIFYPGKCDLFRGDNFSYIGLPVGFATFDDTSGGKTWASIIVASDVW